MYEDLKITKKILLVDADPQGNASTGLGISEEERIPSLYQLLIKNIFGDCIVI